jgi:uncharacterized membrane protein
LSSLKITLAADQRAGLAAMPAHTLAHGHGVANQGEGIMSDERGARQLERLTFFSDAVFAIAITLLVIEIHVPQDTHSNDQAYLHAIWELVPHIFGFALSFLVIGALWVSHHRVFGMLRGHESDLVWPNLLLLLCVAFMPFATAFMAENPAARVPAMFYAGSLLLAGLSQRWLFAKALLPQRVHRDIAAQEIVAARWRSLALPMLASLAGLLAIVVPSYSYLMFGLIPLLARLLATLGRRQQLARTLVPTE